MLAIDDVDLYDAAARAVGRGGRVVGLSPRPEVLARIQQRLDASGLARRATLRQAALARTRGHLHTAWTPPDQEAPGFEADLLTIDDAAADLEDRVFRVLALDLHGGVLEAIEGLGAARPEVILVTLDPAVLMRTGLAPAVIIDRLARQGYRAADLARDAPLRTIVAVRHDAPV